MSMLLERFRSDASCQCFMYHSFKFSSLKSKNAGATNQKNKNAGAIIERLFGLFLAGFSLSSQFSCLALNANSASAPIRSIETESSYLQALIVQMNPVVDKDVPIGNQDNVVVAHEDAVRQSEPPSQDTLERFDSRMGVEAVCEP